MTILSPYGRGTFFRTLHIADSPAISVSFCLKTSSAGRPAFSWMPGIPVPGHPSSQKMFPTARNGEVWQIHNRGGCKRQMSADKHVRDLPTLRPARLNVHIVPFLRYSTVSGYAPAILRHARSAGSIILRISHGVTMTWLDPNSSCRQQVPHRVKQNPGPVIAFSRSFRTWDRSPVSSREKHNT
jgi:hypothetical protein